MLTASESLSIGWRSISVKKITESTQSSESQVVYAVPILDSKNSRKRTKTLSKIGHGSLKRLRQLVIDIQDAGLEIYGGYLYFADFSSEDGVAKNVERHLHRKYASKRYSNANVFGFIGGTEVFDIAAVSVKQKDTLVTREELAQTGIGVESKLPSVHESLLLDGFDYGPAIELIVVEKPSDDRFKSFDFSFTLSNRAITRKDSKALHPVKIEWISNAGNSPFEFYGDPAKGTDSYAQTVAIVKHQQAKISEFLLQWTLTPEFCLLLEDYLDAFEKISLLDLVRFFARYGTRSSDADFIAPKLQKVFDDEVEFFKAHGRYHSGEREIRLTGKARKAYLAILGVVYFYAGFNSCTGELYSGQLGQDGYSYILDRFGDRFLRQRNMTLALDGYYHEDMHSGVHSFDHTYPIELRSDAIRHVSDLLLNPLSSRLSIAYHEGQFHLVGEAFSVAIVKLAFKHLKEVVCNDDPEQAEVIWEYFSECDDELYKSGVPDAGSTKWDEAEDRFTRYMFDCMDEDWQTLVRLWPGSSAIVQEKYLQR